ncbi:MULTISPECIES: hypothetical protein [unclassified Sphingomonas]|uniref:hypothetical protein n=1 Tax=unclassified Sphingomonas TaxID=196159 RepID=UPI0022B5258A|nr:hypothetical protein [Sphingomonas sp. NIBR02145]WHU03900.1 hypothetical protein O3305_04720 [Sphingomonas sp. NIBR02145]
MKELSLLAACATLALMGSAMLPSSQAMAQTNPNCLPELTPDAPPPNPEDNCDEVGNPEEGGTDNPPPPPPIPPSAFARADAIALREIYV